MAASKLGITQARNSAPHQGSGVSHNTATHARVRPFLGTLGAAVPRATVNTGRSSLRSGAKTFPSLEACVLIGHSEIGVQGDRGGPLSSPPGLKGREDLRQRPHGDPPHPRAPENHISGLPTAHHQAAGLSLPGCPRWPCGRQGSRWWRPGPAGGPGRAAGPAVAGAGGGRGARPAALVSVGLCLLLPDACRRRPGGPE